MPFFRMRLILALVFAITLVSLASTYFDVLSHKLVLRRELERRGAWQGASMQPELEQALAAGGETLDAAVKRLERPDETLGLAVYGPTGQLLASAGEVEIFQALPAGPLDKTIRKSTPASAFGHSGDWEWLEDSFPLKANGQANGQLNGVLVVLEDARFIRAEGNAVWQRSFWRIVAFVVLIVAVTMLMVRWFLMRPMMRVAERLRLLRMGHGGDGADADMDKGIRELSLFTPLAHEVETMAESLMEARAAAQAEARLRDAGEHLWTAERLAVHMRERFGSSRIFVVSNREPYMHVRKGGRRCAWFRPAGWSRPLSRCCAPATGCGWRMAAAAKMHRWWTSSTGCACRREDPRYSLRRVWLSSEEESGYYDGFANEGLWPLCHIAHTRPIFRASDWDTYQRVNEKFAAALLDEMEGSANPIVFVQDYHFALLPRLIKAARPDARVAIFWHIPWPNPEAFGICPWQAELLDGLLGADLIGFHIPLHCHNFLDTVDRVLESRTDREHMTARRNGHLSTVRPYAVSVALDPPQGAAAGLARAGADAAERTSKRKQLLAEFAVSCECLALGVDRLDYTKGIVERMLAIEQLLEEHPWHRERLTMVQIAAPSRSRIPSYVELRRKVEETAERINLRYQTARWKPIVLVVRQCSHEEVDRWYRVADLCLVTSLHDGMNLVAKEYLAAREDEDGVLVLSKFTGAAVELRDALLVNPYDIAGVAEAIHEGLEMSRAERRTRMQRMRRHLMDHNVYRWAASILGDLRELRMESAEQPELRQAGPGSVAADAMGHRKLA